MPEIHRVEVKRIRTWGGLIRKYYSRGILGSFTDLLLETRRNVELSFEYVTRAYILEDGMSVLITQFEVAPDDSDPLFSVVVRGRQINRDPRLNRVMRYKD